MRRKPMNLAVAAVAVGALTLTACGGDTDTEATPDPTDSPATQPGDDNATDAQLTDEQAEERARAFLGVDEDRVEELAAQEGWQVRVGRRGDEQFMLTEDYVIGRVTVELDSEDDGETYRVTRATVEAPSGPITVDLEPS